MIIAATGHRPDKFPCGYRQHDPWLLSLKSRLMDWFDINRYQIDSVITGLALGWDMMVADTALQFNIPIHSYVPFQGQENSWSDKSKKHYHYLLDKSTAVIYVSNTYAPGVYHKRDRAMVDDSDVLIALLSDVKEPSGTLYTVNYAYKSNKQVFHFWNEVKNVKTINSK